MQSKIDSNRQEYDEKMNTYDSKLDNLIAMMGDMMDQIEFSQSSPDNKDSPKLQDHAAVAPYKNKDPPLEGVHYTKIGGM